MRHEILTKFDEGADRWVAWVDTMPGICVYGSTKEEASLRCGALAEEVADFDTAAESLTADWEPE